MPHTLHLGDCLDILRTMPDNSVDAVVTDPPYGLSFMGKRWDYDVPSEDIWRECLRVLKPGGHLLAFAGTRTQHRMAVRIEDAGFEIRDMIAWVYGSGFPKSLDVSKAIDKANAEVGRLHKFTSWMRTTGLKAAQIDRITATNMGGHYLTAASQPAIPTPALWELLRPHCGEIPKWVDQLVARIAAEREVVGQGSGAISTRKELRNDKGTVWGADSSTFNITAPATPAARQWQGWGTALKPALEPITVARKPLIGTVAENVLTWGTGGVNVDASRVCGEKGRWPANLIHDGSEEATELLGGAQRFFYCAKASKRDRDEGCEGMEAKAGDTWGEGIGHASGSDVQRRNHHPTVKPTDLMRYLCRLVTPPEGTVLDPFMGSGSTGKAAVLEGFNFIGIEREPEYLEIARARITHAQEQKDSKLL